MALLNVTEGDLVVIPARRSDSVGYVIARVLQSVPWYVLEVFSGYGEDLDIEPKQLEDALWATEERLFSPIRASLDFGRNFCKRKWPVLKLSLINRIDPDEVISDAEWEGPPDQYNPIGLYYKGSRIIYESAGVRRALEGGHIYSNPQLLSRIDLHLRGILAPMRVMNYRVERELIGVFGGEGYLNEIVSWSDRGDSIMDHLMPIKVKFDQYNKVLAKKFK